MARATLTQKQLDLLKEKDEQSILSLYERSEQDPFERTMSVMSALDALDDLPAEELGQSYAELLKSEDCALNYAFVFPAVEKLADLGYLDHDHVDLNDFEDPNLRRMVIAAVGAVESQSRSELQSGIDDIMSNVSTQERYADVRTSNYFLNESQNPYNYFKLYKEDLDVLADNGFSDLVDSLNNSNSPYDKMTALQFLEGYGFEEDDPKYGKALISEEKIADLYKEFLISDDFKECPAGFVYDIVNGLDRLDYLDKEHFDILHFPLEGQQYLVEVLENELEAAHTAEDQFKADGIQEILDIYYEKEAAKDKRFTDHLAQANKEIASEGQQLGQDCFDSIDDALRSGDLTEGELEGVHVTIVNELEFALNGATKVTLESEKAAEYIERKYADDRALMQCLEKHPDFKAELLVTKDEGIKELRVDTRSNRAVFFDTVKNAVDNFAHKFKKAPEKETGDLLERVADGLAKFNSTVMDKVESVYDRVVNKIKEAPIKEDAKKDLGIKRDIAGLQSGKKSVLQGFKEFGEQIKEYHEKIHDIVTKKTNPLDVLKEFNELYKKEQEQRALAKEAVGKRYRELRSNMSFTNLAASLVGTGIGHAKNLVKSAAELFNKQTEQDLDEIKNDAQKNQHKLFEGALKRWTKDVIGHTLAEKASMTVAYDKMVKAFEKETDTILKEQRSANRKAIQIARNEAQQNIKAFEKAAAKQIKEVEASAKEEIKEIRKEDRELDKKAEKLKKQIAEYEAENDPDNADIIESLKGKLSKIEEQRKENVQDIIDIGNVKEAEVRGIREELADKTAKEQQKETEVITKKIDERARFSKEQIEEAARKANEQLAKAKKEVRIKGVDIESNRNEVKSKAVLDVPVSKNAANYAETIKKAGVVEAERAAYDAEAKLARVNDDRGSELEAKRQGKENDRKWDTFFKAVKTGHLNEAISAAFGGTFKEEDAKNIVKSASELREATSKADTLDRFSQDTKELLTQVREAHDKLRDITHEREILEQSEKVKRMGSLESVKLDINKDKYDALMTDFKRLEENELFKNAEFVSTYDGKVQGIYYPADEAPVISNYTEDSVVPHSIEEVERLSGDNPAKKMVDYAIAKGFSEAALDAVLQAASKLNDSGDKVKVSVMEDKLGGGISLCVSQTMENRPDVTMNYMFDKDAMEAAEKGNLHLDPSQIIYKREDSEHILLASDLILGDDKNGNPVLDPSLTDNVHVVSAERRSGQRKAAERLELRGSTSMEGGEIENDNKEFAF